MHTNAYTHAARFKVMECQFFPCIYFATIAENYLLKFGSRIYLIKTFVRVSILHRLTHAQAKIYPFTLVTRFFAPIPEKYVQRA